MVDDHAVREVGHLIRRCFQLHDAIFARQTAGFDITGPQLAALKSIAEHPRIEQSTLAELIAYDSATIVGLIDRLEGKGLVARAVSKTDRRRRELTLTPKGRTLLKNVQPHAAPVHSILLATLTGEERSVLMSLLARVAGIAGDLKDESNEVA